MPRPYGGFMKPSRLRWFRSARTTLAARPVGSTWRPAVPPPRVCVRDDLGACTPPLSLQRVLHRRMDSGKGTQEETTMSCEPSNTSVRLTGTAT